MGPNHAPRRARRGPFLPIFSPRITKTRERTAFMDATVYGVTDGGRRRLGRVTGKREMVFTMPLRTPSRMYLEIDIMAGPRCETERLIVDPGDQLELIIQHENANWRCYGR